VKREKTVHYKVTPADIEEYREKGYWISPKLISDERIAELREEIERLFRGERDGHGWYFEEQPALPEDPRALHRVVNAWWVNDAIRGMVADAGLGEIAGRLMGVSGTRLWSDQAIVKPGIGGDAASDSGNIGWHQDAAYWHMSSNYDNMVTAWIALQDTDLPIGGMRTLAGSHKWGLVENSTAFFEKDLDSQRKAFSQSVNGEWIDEPCVLRAGEASFHHSLCFHGSGPNLTKDPRMSVIGHYMPDTTTFRATGKFMRVLHLLGPHPEPGMPLQEPAFPSVWTD
jgi:ectoine hydroxylase-related dioxygenase (phytanoyl-CoA dioxygenase family)